MAKNVKAKSNQPDYNFPLLSEIPIKWTKRLSQYCPSEQELKEALLFDIGFCIGRGMDYKALYLDNNGKFKKSIDSCASDGLIKALEFIKNRNTLY